ncbi:MAG: hypothetical protein KKC68_03910 [Candidatus Thermoplasmatota archaeon]|nr:hypothetical protein [Candidatus Thermoplasmatota archaeon]MBU1940896.1 hypothetical protein [Candidatus Thermoplasmatota archaeon]
MKKMVLIKSLALSLIALLIIPVCIVHSETNHPSYTNHQQATIMSKNDSYDLLIITPEKFSFYAKPLVTHKNNIGIKTRLVTMEGVYEHMYWEGRDQAEKLKLFIKEAVENWSIKYVLLLGGRKDQSSKETWWVPVRYSYLDRNYGNMEEKKFLTDLYFADIYDAEENFSSWDTNNNGIFGEWQKNSTADDIPDLYPDVSVGRLPCRTIVDVIVMVRKIMRYESRKISDSWFKTMVVVAGDTYPDKTVYYDGEVYTQMGLDIMSDFTPVKLWTSDKSLQTWVDVVRTMNRGCGFIWFSGHGNPSLWGTHPPDDKQTWIYGLRLRQIPFLRNWNKLPICIDGSGCFNSMFNVSLAYSHWVHGFNIPRCWSWALTREINGGSIATIGATAFSYESPDINTGNGGIEWLDLHFFYEYKFHNISILGDVWAYTIASFLQNFTIDWSDTSPDGYALIAKNAEQWLLIGDPSLKIGGY